MNAEGGDRNGILNEPTERSKGREKQITKKRTYKYVTQFFIILPKSYNLT